MSRYRNVNEILSDLENRQGISGPYLPSASLSPVSQSVTSGLGEISSHSEHDSLTARSKELGSYIPLSFAQGVPHSLTESDLRAYRRIAAVLAGLDPPKPRVVPWSATDWVSSESGYSYRDTAFVENEGQARRVPRTAEEWASQYDRYAPSVPAYSTYSGRKMAIDWVPWFQVVGGIFGIIAILVYVACYFAL